MIYLVEKVAKEIFIPFTVGGGISKIDDMRDLLNAGADKVSINTAAIQNPRLIKEASEKFGMLTLRLPKLDKNRQTKLKVRGS